MTLHLEALDKGVEIIFPIFGFNAFKEDDSGIRDRGDKFLGRLIIHVEAVSCKGNHQGFLQGLEGNGWIKDPLGFALIGVLTLGAIILDALDLGSISAEKRLIGA